MTPKRSPNEYAQQVQKRAQEQAKQIIERAKAQAQLIRLRAQTDAEELRQRHVARRQRNRVRAEQLTAQAKMVSERAVRLFQINLANTLTLFNGVCGFLSILASMQHQYLLAVALMFGGVLFDWFDGKAARLFSQETLLGKQLDSLSDFVTFGIAPAVLVSVIAPSFLAFGIGALFVLSAAVRLGRFNVQEVTGVYFGVPTTTNGVLLPLLVVFGTPAIVFPYYLLTMALLMNAPVRLKKVF